MNCAAMAVGSRLRPSGSSGQRGAANRKRNQSLRSTITARRLRVAAVTLRAAPRTFLPRRVWNGIFGVRDRRTQRALEATSPNSDEESETTAREKWPQKRPSVVLKANLRLK